MIPAMTRSPMLKSFTSEPIATTLPAPSCEPVQGSGVSIMLSCTMESVCHSEATATFMRRSKGARSAGTGTEWTL
jgi:hypothetical protein